jgi:AcrR family transcriptional regulator
MSIAHRRKKQPDLVRHQLLDVAARLCIEHGLHALTLDAVAREAGVSKGGLLHHFPSKQALLHALSRACFEDLDRRLVEELARDRSPSKGRFARAYLKVVAENSARPEGECWDNLAVLLLSERDMRAAWNEWLTEQIKAHKDTDDTISSAVVRLACGGLWLSDFTGSPGISQAMRKRLIAHLMEMTRSDPNAAG